MQYFPSNIVIEGLRSLFRKRLGDAVPAYLGDTDAAGARVDVPGRPGYVYVRLQRNSPPFMARSGQAAYPNYPGAPVYVAYRYNGDPEIVGTNYKVLDSVGIDTRALNPLNQQSKWVYPWQLTYGLASAVATATTDSFLVTVKKFRHYVGNLLQAFETPLAADKIDMEPYVPAADMHCYAAVWIDTYLNEAVVTTSVAQAITTPLDETDLQELVVRTASSRPPDATPLKAFYLANDQGTLKQSSLEVDLRLWLYNPPAWGFPTTLTTLERVRPGYTLVTGPYATSGVGALTIESGGKVIIVHKNNFAAIAAPGTGDDSDDGYSVGSLWFDTSTGLLYVATDVSVGAAVWEEVTSSASGGITQLTGDVTAGPGSGSQVATIANGAVSLVKLANNVLHVDTVAPTVNDDSGDGYGVGSVWVNEANGDAYICLDDSVGAAIWWLTTSSGITELSGDIIAGPGIGPQTAAIAPGAVIPEDLSEAVIHIDTVDPDADNDVDEGYDIRSLWYNSTSKMLFICVDPTDGAAVWERIDEDGITQLTGDVTAGPGSGSQVATIANNAITQAKMADNSVGTAEIIDANVTNAKLATDAVTQSKIADNAVGTNELIDDAVTLAKLAHGTAGKVIGFNGSGIPSETTLGSLTVDWQRFETPGSATWTKPAGLVFARVICVAGGSGGGSGARRTTGVARGGGGGGAAGGVTDSWYNASELTASSYDLVVGAGGAGGAAITADATLGNPGTQGGDSWFGHASQASALQNAAASPGTLGGGRGGGGAASTGGVGNTQISAALQYVGANGGVGGIDASSTTDGVNSAFGPGSGGGGGGITAANAAFAGMAGGLGTASRFRPVTGGGGTAGSAAAGGNGGNGLIDGTGPLTFGTGGGGGGPNGNAGRNGGNGGTPGGGGGGGSGSTNGNNSGAGGNGGNGAVIIISYVFA